MTSETSEYKGHPVISLLKEEDEEKPFTFGLVKARLIVDNIDSIKEFVEKNSK